MAITHRRGDVGAADRRRRRCGTRHAVAETSLHRFMGCLLGGIVALACLALQVESFSWWLAMIGGSVWIGMHIQIGRHGVGYVGTQAAFVFIVTLVQGPAPPDQHHAGRRPLRRHHRRPRRSC